ncbi:MAG: glycosyltransferase family 39 protein [Elusimicrobia bacterium]|nr:glycosyltransferase family 39 protein [Elusimicrobiota bacterium]
MGRKKRREIAPVGPAVQPVRQGEAVLGPLAAVVIGLFLLAWLCLLIRRFPLPVVPMVWKALAKSLAQSLAHWQPAGFLGPRLAWLAGIWFVAAGLGGPVVRALGLKAGKAELFLLSSGLGFGALSLCLLGLGSAGLFSPRALTVFAAAAFAASVFMWMRWFPLPEALPPEAGPLPRIWLVAALATLGLVAVLNLFCAACPEIYYDSLTYHLALPRQYLLTGRIAATPHNIYSGSPLGGQMLYGLALAVSDEKLASLLHASFGAAAAGGIFLIGRRWLSSSQGLLAAMLYYTLPMGMYSSWSCGVDHIGAFYCAVGLAAMLGGLETRGTGWAACSGLLLGFAAGTKYNILIVPVLAAAVQGVMDRRAGLGSKRVIVLAGACVAVYLPWMLKNTAFFGNPLYPFLTGLLPGRELIADPAGFFSASRAMEPAAIFSSLSGLKAWASQQRIVFLGDWPTGDWPGPLLPLFAPWALFVPWRRAERRALLACAVFGYISWAVTSGLARFLMPFYPALSLALAASVGHARWPAVNRVLGYVAILYGCLFQVQVAVKQSWNMQFWMYLSGRVSKEDFLLKPHETYALPYYPAARFINKELPAAARVLVLGESRSYYIERETIAATIFDHNPFWEAVRRSKSPEEIRDRVAALGVTHLMVNAYQFLYRSTSAGVLPRDLASTPMFRAFWQKYLKLLFEDRHGPDPQPGWLTVYELLDAPRKDPAVQLNPAYFAVRALRQISDDQTRAAAGKPKAPPK